MQPFLISTVIFLAVGTLFYGIVQAQSHGQGKRAVRGRLAGSESRSARSDGGASILRDYSYSDIPMLDRMLAGQRFSGYLRVWLLQARVNVPPGTILLGTLLLATTAFYAGHMITGHLGAALVAGAIGFYVPIMLVNRKRNKRFAAFARQLPDALTMMKNSLRAGHTLNKAMQVVAEEMPDPLALEFHETVEELHLGVPVKTAFSNLAARMRDRNLDIFVAALMVQREVGGNLNELLGNLAETIRERFRVEQEVRTLTAEGRISGYVVGALPIGLMIIISIMQPEYLKPLVSTPPGIKLLKVAVALQVAGFYLIRRACRINF